MKNLNLFFIRHNRSTPAKRLVRSKIPFYDLTVLLKGALEYTIDGEKINLSAGDCILIRKNSLRERTLSKNGVDYISFNFTVLPESKLPVKLENCVSGEVRMIIAACDEILKKYPDGEELAEPLLECILRLFQSHLERGRFTPLTSQIIHFLRANLASKITLADVGKITFFSPVYCDTVFKRDTGRSIVDYLLDERIAEAKKLLLEGALSLKQIAEQVGYADYNYFSRTFKKRAGFTPTQYRKTVWTK